MGMFRWIIELNDSDKSFEARSLFQALRWGNAARSVKKKKEDEREREEKREEVPLLSPPTLPPVIFLC